ncbi:MAG: hypothetical protein IPJ19_17180 [Planctomycetes bacterium]|nr:hypothetical protein [Planctomycetota bacterium]
MRIRDLFFLLLAALALFFGLYACTSGGRLSSGGVLQQDWNQRRGPVVPHDNFPRDCSLCHEGGSWSRIRADFAFDHEKEAGTPLRGAHARAECLRCHNDRGPVQLFAGRGCAGCHEDVHRGKQGNQCADCHDETKWSIGDAIALHERTRFPLFGAHAAVECWRCHPGAQVGNFDRAATQCATCHQAELASATNPDHLAEGWTSDCQRCHSTVGWTSAAFNHSWWPLQGAHATPPRSCTDCHTSGSYSGLQSTCAGCHQANYDATMNPPHAAGNFPTNCQVCHGTAHWQPATFTHSGVGFELSGAHTSPPLACAACHVGGNYGVTLPTNCVGCHQVDYDATSAPDHAQLGIPTACAQCHTTAPHWHPVHMDHTGLVGTCQECHTPDYNSTSNPDHELQGYPLECAMCHSSSNNWHTVSWNPNTSHDPDFPLPHHGSRCNQCHTTTQVFTSFSCISGGCHGQSGTNGHHHDVNDYQYNSNACYECHPDGHAHDDLTGQSGRRGARSLPVRPSRATPGRRAPPRRIPGPARPQPPPPTPLRP